MRFNRQTLEALNVPAGKASILAWDDSVKGFGIRVNAGGSRTWIVQYRDDTGSTQRITVGKCDAVSLDDARRRGRTILAEVQTGGDPKAEKAAKRAAAAITLGTTIETYLAGAKILLKTRSYEEVERHLRRHWAPLHATPLASIRRADVAARLACISEDTGSINANRSRAYLSAFFTWAIGAGIGELNPVIGTNKAADEVSRDRVLTEAELRAVWNACQDDDYGVIVRLLILTAQRRDEVGAMLDSELNVSESLWTIPADRTKNKRPHEVPLSETAASLLAGKPRVSGNQTVFGRRGTGFSGWSQCKTRLDARIAESGVTVAPWRLHDLRRTAATLMAERLAIPPHIIEAVLNHVSGSRAGVAGVYNRAIYRKEKQDALNRWSEYLNALVRQDDARPCLVIPR